MFQEDRRFFFDNENGFAFVSCNLTGKIVPSSATHQDRVDGFRFLGLGLTQLHIRTLLNAKKTLSLVK